MKMTYDDFEPPEAPCSECERLKQKIAELERKVKQKENQRSRMQSQRDHMSQKLAELTGMTPKEVRDGVKLLALGLKDKLAVKPEPEKVEFDGIPGKWFPHTPGEPCPVDLCAEVEVLIRSEVGRATYDYYPDFGKMWHWEYTNCYCPGDEIIAYRPADREDMR